MTRNSNQELAWLRHKTARSWRKGYQLLRDFALNDDFVALTDAHAVSPSLKIAVWLGHWNLEMNGVQEVNVEYDPQIHADHLMMPESESPYYIKPIREPDKIPMIPFFSRDRVRVTQFYFSHRVEGETLVFYCGYDDHSARHATKALSRLPVRSVMENPVAVLQLILQSIGCLRAWPNVVPGLSAPRSIEIRIGSRFVAALYEGASPTMPIAVPCEYVLARWEL